MAARVLCIINLLKEAKKSDDLQKRRQAREFREFRTISRDAECIGKIGFLKIW